MTSERSKNLQKTMITESLCSTFSTICMYLQSLNQAQLINQHIKVWSNSHSCPLNPPFYLNFYFILISSTSIPRQVKIWARLERDTNILQPKQPIDPYFIQQFQMRVSRPRQQNFSKQFRFIPSKAQFFALEVSQADPEQKESKKNQIYTPKTWKVKSVDGHPQKLQMGGYHRLLDFNLQNSIESYQLSDRDQLFLQEFLKSADDTVRALITQQTVEQMIVELQKQAGRDINPINYKQTGRHWLVCLLERIQPQKYSKNSAHYQKFMQALFNYWRSRREQLKFPLLRVYWNALKQDNNQYRAFRPRTDIDKRNLRRSHKTKATEEQVRQMLQAFYDQANQAVMLACRIRVREQCKRLKFKLESQNFWSNFRKKQESPSHLSQQLYALKQTVNEMSGQLQSISHKQQQPQIKGQCINFIATVINVAATNNIDYDDLLVKTQKVQVQKHQKNPLPTYSTLTNPQLPSPSSNHFNFGLSLAKTEYGKFLVHEGYLKRERPWRFNSESYFGRKESAICQKYFFWEDNQEEKDTANLKKNISAGFRKWKETADKADK